MLCVPDICCTWCSIPHARPLDLGPILSHGFSHGLLHDQLLPPVRPSPVGWLRRGGPCDPRCFFAVGRSSAYTTTPWVNFPSSCTSVPLVESQLHDEGVAKATLSGSNALHFPREARRAQRRGDDLVQVRPQAQTCEPFPVIEAVRLCATGASPVEPMLECRACPCHCNHGPPPTPHHNSRNANTFTHRRDPLLQSINAAVAAAALGRRWLRRGPRCAGHGGQQGAA
jgi:hypothetical protein